MILTDTEKAVYAIEASELAGSILEDLEVSQRDGDIAMDRWQYGMTYKALAEDYGVSKERIRQILARVERKLILRMRRLKV
jgi:hypothetical protein